MGAGGVLVNFYEELMVTSDNKAPRPVLLAEYRPPLFLVNEVELRIDLYDDHALVQSRLRLRRNPVFDQARGGPTNGSGACRAPARQPVGGLSLVDPLTLAGSSTVANPLNLISPLILANALILDGEGLELLELRLDGVELRPEAYRIVSDWWMPAADQGLEPAIEPNRAIASEAGHPAEPGQKFAAKSGPSAESGRAAPDETEHPATHGRCQLIILNPPDNCTLEMVSRIFPAANTTLEGLYCSGAMFCTQCEPEGFRKISWYPDRPDVSAPFTVTISADRQRCPVLLAGGNPVGRGTLTGGRHWATFRDPFPKSSYLFAMVAGDLVGVHDRFVTGSGLEVALTIYVEAHNRDKCRHAMTALQKAMRWDEETFGLEYDLDHYLIVAVDDFNMGAMENKGLNIFNSRYVLARPESATDDDFERIEAVIAHEYFHNWTGNRVTCRDWFQLSLKEGLTVFRDQIFSQDMGSSGVKRINDVRRLREQQFAEDAGPLAHPVRPESYLEINNFYTLTVYEKGSELVRMLHTLLGKEKFRRGLRLYLKRHDGGAATIEDFLAAMAEAGARDLRHFQRWYTLAGTPWVRVSDEYDPVSGRYVLRAEQDCPTLSYPLVAQVATGIHPPATQTAILAQPEEQRPQAEKPQSDQSPPLLHIPLVVGLLAPDGRELAAGLLELKDKSAEFIFEGLSARPVPSLLRGFSAPVHLEYAYNQQQLRLLLAHDADPFCRWEASQRLSGSLLLALIAKWRAGEKLALPGDFVESYRQLLTAASRQRDKSLSALLLALPTEDYLAEQMVKQPTKAKQGAEDGQATKTGPEAQPEALIDVEAIHAVREFVRHGLAEALRREWQVVYGEARLAAASESPTATADYDPHRAGCRRWQNLALSFLLALAEDEILELAHAQFAEATTMTDTMAALKGLVHGAQASTRAAVLAVKVLTSFATRWGADPLVMDKWFTVQATVPGPETLDKVRNLMNHPAFKISNPNRVRALIGSFAGANPTGFHRVDGKGYRFLAEQILALDPGNPQIATRLATSLSRWRRYDQIRQQLMRRELTKIAAAPDLSRDLYEVVSKSLG